VGQRRHTQFSEAGEAKRVYWNERSDQYVQGQGKRLDRFPAAWGDFRVPEAKLHVLGEVAGKDVLDFGCGAAEWSIALGQMGAKPTGLDVSERQLEHARRKMALGGVDFQLVHASGDAVPLPDASFDIVFSDGGVLSHVAPELCIPETARLLRPGGLLAFCWMTAFAYAHQVPGEFPSKTLASELFDLRGFSHEGRVHFALPHGEAIRLFHDSGFEVEDLIELRTPERALSVEGLAELGLVPEYLSTAEWGHRWPLEEIWRLRRRSA
jgi:2-polyprenyl-3-methyl-5-hydroxy-6-metoxy-1,4-benzoquinol methylase